MKTPREMGWKGLAAEFKQVGEHMAGSRRFCFILGAGASRSSGIPTAGEFVQQWLKQLHERCPTHADHTFDQWLSLKGPGIADFSPDRAAEFYPQVYDKTFGHDPERGYAYLENAMHKAEPRYGYAVLAQILEKTNHKVVITTNFDSMVEDALANYESTFPLVCGHDALAPFASDRPRRPVILKVHRGLFYAPMSQPGELARIGEAFKAAIQRLLQSYTPIVIGYGGNDGSLMQTLLELPERTCPGGVYWCYRAESGRPRPQILDFIARQNGHLVDIPGFDELMALLGQKTDYQLPDQTIVERAKVRAEMLVKHRTELQDSSKPKLAMPGSPVTTGPGADNASAIMEALKAGAEPKGQPRRWWQWQTLIDAAESIDQAQALSDEAISDLPDSVELLGNYANFLKSARQDHDRAQALYERAIEADPKHANNLGNYALFLTDVRQDHDRAQALYERAIEADPKHANNLGNYALFLTEIRQDHDRAQALYERTIEADPIDANHLGNFAIFLKDIRQDHDRAEALYERAIEADPKDANHLGNYAIFLKNIRRDHDRAQALYERAIEADPKYGNALGNYAIFLTDVRRDHDRAQALYERAIEADPKHANNLGNFACLLLARGETKRGLTILEKAFEAERQQPAVALRIELLFYLYCHAPWQEAPKTLRALRALLEVGARSPNWNLRDNTAWARKLGHPEGQWLERLASVINDDAPLDSLNAWVEWQKANSVSSDP